MKYVLLGTLNTEWATKQSERTAQARAKAQALGIKIEGIYYTQGEYDFVDVIDAPDAEAALAFSVWYSSRGFGRLRTMPAFDEARFNAAVGKAGR